MRVFVTGATGFVGLAVVRDLLGAGHEVLGLARSERSAARVRAAGAEPVMGSLEDTGGLRRAAERADGVIHTAFDNGSLWRFPLSSRTERAALHAIGDVLAGSERPFVAAGGFAPVRGDLPLDEEDPASPRAGLSGRNVERTVVELTGRGVNASVVRMPCVHGDGDRFTLPRLVALARRHGRSPWVGTGDQRLPAVHRDDVARVYRLACERAIPGARYHAVAEEGIAYRDVAEAIGRGLGVPALGVGRIAAARHFGPMLAYVGRDAPASSVRTREELGWRPGGPGLLDDLRGPAYFTAPR